MTEDFRKKGGRPRSTDPKVAVHAWISTAAYDRIIRVASARGQSVSHVMRTILNGALTKHDPRPRD